MKYIDIHSHVNFSAFDEDRDEVIKRALDQEVAVINVGTQKDTSKKALELAQKFDKGVYAIVGLHPIHTSASFHDKKELGSEGGEFTSRGEDFEIATYRSLALNPKVVGIGECGLDYYRLEGEKYKKQEEAFRKQIKLAIEAKKPLMLHLRSGNGRSAYKDAYEILKNFNFSLRTPGNLHFFAGAIAEAKLFLDMGFTFSFTGVITFADDYDKIIKYLPDEKILSETDSPYVAPAPYRGKRNEPLYVKEVVKKIAEIKGYSKERMREIIAKNAENLFGIS